MPYPRKPTPEKHCEACGTKLERRTFGATLEDLTAFGKRRFCDRRCMAVGTRKPDATEQAVRRRQWPSRGQVCQDCGKSTGKIELHHMDENPANDAPENLRTLCTSCHQKWHWSHGQRRARRRALRLSSAPA